MRTYRPRAVPACTWVTAGIVGLSSLISACGGRDASREPLVYDLWSGGNAATDTDGTVDNSEPADPDSPSPSDSVGPLTGDGSTVVAGATEGRGEDDSPVLEVSVVALDFGESESSLTFQVHNAGGGSMDYTIAADQEWLSATPTSGTNEGAYDDIRVQVDRTGLDTGTYSGVLTVATADGSQETVAVSMSVPEPPADESGPARAAWFFWGWPETEAQVAEFLAGLEGHFSQVVVMVGGDASGTHQHIEFIMGLQHRPPTVIAGMSTLGLLAALDDPAGWAGYAELAAWCVQTTGTQKFCLDIESQADDVTYRDQPLDYEQYAAGLRTLATALPASTHVYFYPPNVHQDCEHEKVVLRRTRLIDIAARTFENFHTLGNTVCSLAAYQGRNNGLAPEFAGLEASWSTAPGAAEQIYVISDDYWPPDGPDTLRPILATIPRECWLFTGGPFNAQGAAYLVRCLEPP